MISYPSVRLSILYMPSDVTSAEHSVHGIIGPRKEEKVLQEAEKAQPDGS